MRIANGTLILAVDGRKILILRNDGDADYPVLTTLEHEEADNPASREQGTDAPGRAFSSVDGRRSAMGETDWHEQAEGRFAVQAADRLERLADAQPSDLVVVAPPRILGELRKHYGTATKRHLFAEVGKDLTGHNTDEIGKALAAHEN